MPQSLTTYSLCHWCKLLYFIHLHFYYSDFKLGRSSIQCIICSDALKGMLSWPKIFAFKELVEASKCLWGPLLNGGVLLCLDPLQILWPGLPGPLVGPGGLDKASTKAHYEYQCPPHRGRHEGGHLIAQGPLLLHHHWKTDPITGNSHCLLSQGDLVKKTKKTLFWSCACMCLYIRCSFTVLYSHNWKMLATITTHNFRGVWLPNLLKHIKHFGYCYILNVPCYE